MDNAAGEQAQECPWCGDADHFNEECTEPVTGEQTPTRKELLGALRLANDAMNYMGDVLNGMDAVEEEDEARTGPAFAAVRRALGISMDGDEEYLT